MNVEVTFLEKDTVIYVCSGLNCPLMFCLLSSLRDGVSDERKNMYFKSILSS